MVDLTANRSMEFLSNSLFFLALILSIALEYPWACMPD